VKHGDDEAGLQQNFMAAAGVVRTALGASMPGTTSIPVPNRTIFAINMDSPSAAPIKTNYTSSSSLTFFEKIRASRSSEPGRNCPHRYGAGEGFLPGPPANSAGIYDPCAGNTDPTAPACIRTRSLRWRSHRQDPSEQRSTPIGQKILNLYPHA